ncbi:MAG: DUF1992 domain-containing protein [Acidimicrobiales bacterium]
MVGRKPAGVSWESWIDAVIREGHERGEFDDLPGHGKPLAGLDRPRHEMWWVRQKLRDEGVSFLPPALAIRKDREDTLASLGSVRSEQRVRQRLEELNGRIGAINSGAIDGPPSNVWPVDIESVVAEWLETRAEQALADPEPAAVSAEPASAPVSGRQRLWRRSWRRRR